MAPEPAVGPHRRRRPTRSKDALALRERNTPPGVVALVWKMVGGHLAGALDEHARTQMSLDRVVERDGRTYSHAWFAWELLRRNEREWTRRAWWSRSFEGPITSQQLAYRRAFDSAWMHLDRYLEVETDEFSYEDWEKAPRPHDREFSFPEPDAHGNCPDGASDIADLLWVLLAPYCRVPVVLARDTLFARGESVSTPPGTVPVYLSLHADRDSLDHAMEILRSTFGGTKPPHPRSAEIWGRDTMGYGPTKAIQLLIHMEQGGTLQEWAEREFEPYKKATPPSRRQRSIKQARDTAKDVLRRLRKAIEHDPLRPLRPPWDPPYEMRS